MRLLRRFLRFFFWHFYHGFAWTYDFVAALVSIGRWNDWVRSAMPFIEGHRVLEVGHGPGHLQRDLRRSGLSTVAGLDESPQMGALASRKLRGPGFGALDLVRGVGQALPFAPGSFDSVVATFPTEYIFEAVTLHEVRRVLAAGGRFVVMPAAWIIGRRTLDRLAAWLFKVTDQAPRLPAEVLGERLCLKFEQAGFSCTCHTVEVRSSQVFIIVAEPGPMNQIKESSDQQASRAG